MHRLSARVQGTGIPRTTSRKLPTTPSGLAAASVRRAPPPTATSILPASPDTATTSKTTPRQPADRRGGPTAPFPREPAQSHASPRPPSASEAPLDTHGGGARRSRRPAEGSLEPFLPQGLVLGEVAGQLQKGVGAPALRLHQLPHSHGAKHGRRQSPPGCTWPRDDTGPTSGRAPSYPPLRQSAPRPGTRQAVLAAAWAAGRPSGNLRLPCPNLARQPANQAAGRGPPQPARCRPQPHGGGSAVRPHTPQGRRSRPSRVTRTPYPTPYFGRLGREARGRGQQLKAQAPLQHSAVALKGTERRQPLALLCQPGVLVCAVTAQICIILSYMIKAPSRTLSICWVYPEP